MVSVGEKLDLGFQVKAVVDGEKWEGPLSDLISKPTVISVYMRNNTSSCDKQTQQLQAVATKLADRDIAIIGLSKDTSGAHLKYACKLELGFPLISDPDHQFAKVTKSLVEKKMYGKTFWGPTRSAYLIDADGTVRAFVEKVDSAEHGSQLLALTED